MSDLVPTRFAIVDLETTGADPEKDQVIEVASIRLENGRINQATKFHRMVCPTIPIPPEASAVHHLTIQDLFQAPPWEDVVLDFIDAHRDVEFFAAHKASFEEGFLRHEFGKRPVICTMKCAMRAWPEAPAFGNQVLRYWKNPDGIDRLIANETHRAFADAYTTAFLLRELLAEHDVETLTHWSREPAMPPRLTFGKHKGLSWDDAPLDYLEWIVDKSDLDGDTKHCARHHLERRKHPPEGATYLALAFQAIRMAKSLSDLHDWWRDELGNRVKYGFLAGTTEYERLIMACAAQKKLL